MQDDSGLVHLMWQEHAFCGFAFDAGAVDEDAPNMEDTSKRTVTCPECARVMLVARGVRIAPEVLALINQYPDYTPVEQGQFGPPIKLF